MSAQKKRRIEEPLQLIGLPDEILVHTMSYLNPQETWQVSCVSSWLCEVATNCLREAALEADPLSADIFKSIHIEKKKNANGNSVASLRPVAIWKNLLVGRKKCMHTTEYHSVWNGGIPFELPPHEGLPPISWYRFAVRLWVKDRGNDDLSAITVRVEPQCSPSDIVFLIPVTKESLQGELGVSRRLESGDYFALEILLSDITEEATSNTKWATLYSSLRPLQPYGGGSFEEYEAMPWFVGDIDEGCHHRAAPKWAWLPFSKVDIDTFSDQTRINLRFQWLARQGQSLNYQYTGGILEGFNRLIFLKHRFNQATQNDGGNSKLPRCLRTPLTGLENFVPKPLEAYSFRIDIQKESDPSEKQSILFEGLPNEDLYGDFPRLSFEIPKEYHDCFPWAEDYGDGTNAAQLVEFDEKISVYAFDRHTGKQAKVFESGACEIWEHFNFHPFLGFENSAALSKYNFGPTVPTIPVPAIAGMMHEAWKEGDFFTGGESPPSSRTFQLSLQFQCYSGLGRGTATAVGNVGGKSKDILTFLEKGLAYK